MQKLFVLQNVKWRAICHFSFSFTPLPKRADHPPSQIKIQNFGGAEPKKSGRIFLAQKNTSRAVAPEDRNQPRERQSPGIKAPGAVARDRDQPADRKCRRTVAGFGLSRRSC